MQPVLELISRVGPSDANVLIPGENGTGKDVIARRLHGVSAARRPWSSSTGRPRRRRLRERTVRPRQRRVHRRQDRSRRTLRARRRRHAVPRRDRQRPAQPASQAAARARNRRVERLGPRDPPGGRPHRLGHQCGSGRGSRGRPVPPGPAVPPQHDRNPAAPAARRREDLRCSPSTFSASTRTATANASPASRAARCRCARHPGRATSANSITRSSEPC